jgi:hypothetical protein
MVCKYRIASTLKRNKGQQSNTTKSNNFFYGFSDFNFFWGFFLVFLERKTETNASKEKI